jgi:hypothetical protein
MKTKKEYKPVKSTEGTDVYCPIDAISTSEGAEVDEIDECIEKDVVERYSGNINIKDK